MADRSSSRRPARLVPRLVLLGLLFAASACGSRVEVSGDGGLGEETGSTEPSGTDGALGPESAKLGSIDNPCGGDAGGETPSGVPGVSEDQIRIGVISDRENDLAPVPTVGIEEAVKAFVAFCNAAGGINGRELVLETYDSKVLSTDDVTKEACAADLFALVGSGSVQDQLGVETRTGCGLPEVAAYSATSTRSESDLFFQPIPGTQSHFFNVGACRWIAEQYPDAVTKAAIAYADLPAASVRAAQMSDNCEAEAGFDFVVDFPIALGTSNFGPLVSQMKSKGVKYLTLIGTVPDALAVLREAKEQDVGLEVIDLGQQYYDPAVATDEAADGAHVLTNTYPFSEVADIPVLQLYLDWLDEVGATDAQITTLGVQAFSASLLWATATTALGDDLSREGLVTELEGITEWDGGGLHMTTDPGQRKHNDCFLYLEVAGGEFEREFPDSGFECNPDDVIETTKAYEG